jgi:hypothetical protein
MLLHVFYRVLVEVFQSMDGMQADIVAPIFKLHKFVFDLTLYDVPKLRVLYITHDSLIDDCPRLLLTGDLAWHVAFSIFPQPVLLPGQTRIPYVVPQ